MVSKLFAAFRETLAGDKRQPQTLRLEKETSRDQADQQNLDKNGHKAAEPARTKRRKESRYQLAPI